MIEKGRKTNLAILTTIAILFGLGAVAPAFAWNASSFSTQLNPSSCGTSSGCSVASVTDTASVTLSNAGAPVGVSVTFNVYSGVCSDHSSTSLLTSTKSITSANGLQQVTSDAFSTTGHTGNFVWIVTYNAGNYPLTEGSTNPVCEQMKLLAFPPVGVPQFPLGMALLLALAIPGLLLVRSKYASKTSSSPI